MKTTIMEISLITDEISADLETAIELGTEWGVRNFELRGYFANRVPHLTLYQKDKLNEILGRYQSRIIALSPGLFKFPISAERWGTFPVGVIEAENHRVWRTAVDLVKVHLYELLPKTIALAKELGVTTILAFSFQRSDKQGGNAPDLVKETLREAAELTASEGMKLAIEVESGFWADTGARTARLLNEVNHPGLGVNWDLANALEAGDIPFPDGYSHIQKYLTHLHFKDARLLSDNQYEYTIGGNVDWNGQIQALVHDGYAGFISVETHMQPKVASAHQALLRLRQLINPANLPIQEF